ncbi:MAG TPA: bilirubin oxidase [Anaerolineaceae bacterium]|nr:bilirubin oxidase [Anaerolineaceae bacterium]HBA90438.1 bilirubin oxidase [Anaerolineaceae bacterium]
MTTRREFLKLAAMGGFSLFLPFKIDLSRLSTRALAAAIATLPPTAIPQFVTPLVIPPAMPRTAKIKQKAGKNIDYYEIAVRQFQQQILPAGMPATTVWSYGSVNHPGTFNYPAFTIEAKYNTKLRVKWVNDLKDPFTGNYLPHLLAGTVDQTLHWANPPGGPGGTDTRGTDPNAYTGPVPIVTHVHGAHTYEESDGYAEAWYLPDGSNIPAGYARGGTYYDKFAGKASGVTGAWPAGTSIFDYPNSQRATTLWYHDHSLGMTRLNVYAGPAGFYLLRGGPSDRVLDGATGLPGVLPGPAPALGDLPGMSYYEIPIAIQDRSFNADGSLFYPDNRAFFEGLDKSQLQIPFVPDATCDDEVSDISPIWNPEFFGNTIVVNGNTWPYLNVEAKRYRFRFLNGCNSRFLILQNDAGLPFHQIGAEGGFLPAPVALNQLLMAPAERADVIMDFSGLPEGTVVTLLNLGPDEPFGGGVPDDDFDVADPATTGQVMQFIVGSVLTPDLSTPVAQLVLPAHLPLPEPTAAIRRLSLNELDSKTVRIREEDGSIVEDCLSSEPFGPREAVLGTVIVDPDTEMFMPMPMEWMHKITENPDVGATEIWEIHNFTMDAHPIHIHQVQFEVVDRVDMDGVVRGPELWETGLKDTVIAYPDEVTRVKATFDLPGLYVWHCHIVEHEDNEMMRPFFVGPMS